MNITLHASAALRSIRFLIPAVVALLAACGGGGGDSGSPPFGGGDGTVQAADLALTLSAPILNNSGSEVIVATVTAVDKNRNTVAGIPVQLSVDKSATVLTSGSSTEANGTVTGQIGIGADSSNRSITVRAQSGSLVRTATLQVIGTRLTGTPLPAVLSPSAAGKIQFKLVNANAIPMAGVDITVTGADGTQTDAKTGLNGEYEYTYIAPSAGATINIRASAAGVEVTQSVLVQAGPGAIPNVPAGSVRSASVRANPSVVTVNTDSTSNRAEIRALFLGDANAPIKNIRVRFDLAGDLSSIGGTFSTNPDLVYSDANGVATSSYIPGTRFSPTDKVTVRACWDYADFADGTCPNPTTTTTLTVISDALSVAIGTNQFIEDGSSGLTYVKRYVVQVNDSSGLAKQGVLVSPLLDLTYYRKGEWIAGAKKWEKFEQPVLCPNEDLNRNGVSEVYSNGGVEDANDSYNKPVGRPALDPPKAVATVSFEGAASTNAVGQVVIRLEYPKSYGGWVDFNLIVAAAGVAGTEGRANYTGLLPVAAADVTSVDVEPAFRLSPFGLESSGFIAVTVPGESVPTLLCTNKN